MEGRTDPNHQGWAKTHRRRPVDPGGGRARQQNRFWKPTATSRSANGRRRRIVLLATAIEQAAETVVITDRDAKIQYANPAFTRTTGYTRDEALGQNPARPQVRPAQRQILPGDVGRPDRRKTLARRVHQPAQRRHALHGGGHHCPGARRLAAKSPITSPSNPTSPSASARKWPCAKAR